LQGGITIAVDAMSGDHGPSVCVPGALEVLREQPALRIALVGMPAALDAALASLDGGLRARIEIVPATQVVAMDERPRDAIRRKKDSSLRRAIDLVAAGRAAACVSSGNTGALMSTAHFVLGMIEGIERPAIVSKIPASGGHTCMLDLGANISASPAQLVQFALTGSVVAAELLGRPRPRVGLLNIGSEDIKGHEIVKAAHLLLQQGSLGYVGYVEGSDLFTGVVDVVATDGFTGNVVLKTCEGIAEGMFGLVRRELDATPLARLGAAIVAPALRNVAHQIDYTEVGGALLAGVARPVVIAHGRSDAAAIASAIRSAATFVACDLAGRIAVALVEPA